MEAQNSLIDKEKQAKIDVQELYAIAKSELKLINSETLND